MADLKIACALINKFHPPIEDPPHAAQYVTIAKRRLYMPNYLSEYVELENINRRRAIFTTIEGNIPHLERFPILTIYDLKRFALGT